MLLSVKLPLPSTIFVHGFLMVEGGKMSKTIGNIVDPFFLVKKYGVDAVRYFLLREMPLAKDGNFSTTKFEEHYNSDLASGLGNLLSRVIPLAQKTKAFPELSDESAKEAVEEVEKSFQKAAEGFNFREALSLIWSLIAFCDQYIEQEELWKETEKKKKVVNNLLFVLQKISTLLSPFLPQSAIKIQQHLKEGKVGKPLFPRTD
jgi:methionyl-tRNA synthetase